MEHKSTSAKSDHSPGKGAHETFAVRTEVKKPDSKTSPHEEPKPRIVLTFRSEKPGVKSSCMKIVSPEEKHDEMMRNANIHSSQDSHDEDNESPSKRSKGSQPASSDEGADSTPKRSTRCRVKEYSENVLANAIARKEKSFNEKLNVTQRPSRRIKPTAKILANKELRVGLENINIGRQGSDKADEGVQTRRSLRRRSPESHSDISLVENSPKKKKHHHQPVTDDSMETDEVAEEQHRLNKMKKKHLSQLGLKPNDEDVAETGDDSTMDSNATYVESKAEAEEEFEDVQAEVEGTEDSEEDMMEELLTDDDDENDEDFNYDSTLKEASEKPRTRSTRQSTVTAEVATSQASADEDPKDSSRRSRRRRLLKPPPVEVASDHSANEQEHSEAESVDENEVRRSNRRRPRAATPKPEPDDVSEPPEADEGEVTEGPEEPDCVIGACDCEKTSKVYAVLEGDAGEAVFCRAIDTVDGVRVGCSLPAGRLPGGALAPLRRAGPRTPYLLLCTQHAQRIYKHMCCATCGLFCTQGTFNQCPEGHLFHIDCSLSPLARGGGGCPHCGTRGPRGHWAPVSRGPTRVHLALHTSHHAVYLPEQRVQSTPAYQTFSTLDPSLLEQDPVIPQDLLPPPSLDLKALFDGRQDEPITEDLEAICEAMANDATAEDIAGLIVGTNLNKPLDIAQGGTLAHLAAKYGNLTALYLLQYGGANLDETDATLKTPLMVAICTLLEKSTSKTSKTKLTPKEADGEVKEVCDKDSKTLEEDNTIESEENPVDEQKLMKVIRYLVATGCDVNFPGPDGMTALHLAAQLGGAAAVSVLLTSIKIDVDARDHGGWSPLVWAAENKHPDVVRLLLKHGADASSIDSEGNGALHWCALAGDQVSLRLLLENSTADAVNALNSHGDTPLHIAARQGFYPCVVILLARGARTDIENGLGEVAAQTAAGECRAAITINMQLRELATSTPAHYSLLSSDISCGREAFPIPCINEVDDAPPPDNFTYVISHVTPANIAVDNSIATLQGCQCTGSECDSATRGCACAALGIRRWWRAGRLLPSFPYHEPPMLFQCNTTCTCHLKQCSNSHLSRLCRTGATFTRVQVFRTARCGWGLRSAAAVPRGAPVATYCGELITVDDADARQADQYMFALDIKPDLLEQCTEKTQLCVDAATYGSAARFINHSCRANLAPVRVFTHTRDLRLPVVALFAVRDIKPFEELTFDYGDKFWSVKRKIMKCECGATMCRYPTRDEETT